MLKQTFLFVAFFLCTLAFVGVAEHLFSPIFAQCITDAAKNDNQSAAEKHPSSFFVSIRTNIRCTGDFLNHNAPGISALATAVIAAFTYTLWIATRTQAKLTQETLVADHRAFIAAKDVFGLWERNTGTGEYCWRFRPIWENTGNTPTSQLLHYTEVELLDSELPRGFDFTTTTHSPGVGLFTPRSTTLGGLAPNFPRSAITPADIIDIKAGRKHLYLWGWASYKDIFPHTKEHITRFCWIVLFTGDPTKFTEGQNINVPGSLRVSTIHHFEGNGADDDTAPQPRTWRS
jgi:hypothetical protein